MLQVRNYKKLLLAAIQLTRPGAAGYDTDCFF